MKIRLNLLFLVPVFLSTSFASQETMLSPLDRAVSSSVSSSVLSLREAQRRSNSVFSSEPRTRGLKILVISDLNASYGSLTYSPEVGMVIDQIGQIKPDIVLCGGDMVAGQKATLTEDNINGMWQNFNNNVLQPINRLKIPFGFTIGNHDGSPGFKTDRKLASAFWEREANSTRLNFVNREHYPYYYSYLKGNVFFISWDASAAKIDPEVYAWMKEQLESKAAKKAGLRILLGHLPLYAIVAAKNKPGEVNADPAQALQFFKENGIDLYISGHQHAYFPANKDGFQLLNAGAIGDGPRQLLGSAAAPVKTYTIIEVPHNAPKKFTYKTYTAGTNELMELNTLPDSVAGFNGTVFKERARTGN